MDTALPQKFPFILDRNLAKANCTGIHLCTSCDTVVLEGSLYKHAIHENADMSLVCDKSDITQNAFFFQEELLKV